MADNQNVIMRIISHYKLVVDTARESVEKEVNEYLQHHGYELYGSPFSCANSYAQALIKYTRSASSEMPSTLQR
jgi:hypothetical protein